MPPLRASSASRRPLRHSPRLAACLAGCSAPASHAARDRRRATACPRASISTRSAGCTTTATIATHWRRFSAESRARHHRLADSRWIDSICYFTMAGECYYQLGQLPAALDSYNSALKLYVAYSDWMMRVQFPPTILPATVGAVRATPWGQSKRGARDRPVLRHVL